MSAHTHRETLGTPTEDSALGVTLPECLVYHCQQCQKRQWIKLYYIQFHATITSSNILKCIIQEIVT